MRVWVDASTLIALDTIGELAFLRDLMGRVAITAAIAEEVFSGRESQALQEARGGGNRAGRDHPHAGGGNRTQTRPESVSDEHGPL